MHHTKAQLIVGGGIGMLAILGIAVSLLRPSATPYEDRVETCLANLRGAPQALYRDVDAKLGELRELLDDGQFRRLPEKQQTEIQETTQALQAFRAFAQQAAEIPAPAAAKSDADIKSIRDKVAALEQLPGYRAEWARTEAGENVAGVVADLKVLETAVYDTRRAYLELVDAGKDVLRNDSLPQLPQRARQVIDRSLKLPAPDRELATAIPGAPNITYAAVFQFAAVQQAMHEWNKVRDQLQPLTLPARP